MEYMRDEAKYILGINNEKTVMYMDKKIKEVDKNEEKPIVVFDEVVNEVKDNIKVLEIKEEKKEEKKSQRQKEKLYRDKLKREGVNMLELFTLENVRGWLGEGLSYACIASERLGCRQEEVSKFAKRHGLVESKRV
jgi:5'-3' exonuclease